MKHHQRMSQLHNSTEKKLSVKKEALSDRKQFNQHQTELFDELSTWFNSDEATPKEVIPRLDQIIKAAFTAKQQQELTTLTPNCLDIGAGAGILSSRILTQVPQAKITAIDLSKKQLENLKNSLPKVHCWQGDIVDYHSKAQFDHAWCNACFGNFFDQQRALHAISQLLTPIGNIIISHPLGAGFVEELHRKNPATVPHRLPTQVTEINRLIKNLSLTITEFVNEPDLYILVLKKPK